MPTKNLPRDSVRTAARVAARGSTESWERDRRLQELGFESYESYLSSTRWYETKRLYRKSDLPQDCQLCESDDKTDLHHQTYERVGAEKLTDLVPLCKPCHQLVHVLARRGDLDGYDAESFGVLLDEQRARVNRVESARREKRQKEEFNFLKIDRELDQRQRRVRRQLSDALNRAKKEGVAIDPALDGIERVAQELHETINAHKSKAA